MKRDPRIEAFCELVAMGWPLSRASECVGLSADSSNASKLARRPYPSQLIQRLRDGGAVESRVSAFTVLVLRTGSLAQAYRSTHPCEDIADAAIRARASRLFRQLEVQARLRNLARCMPPHIIHKSASTFIQRAEPSERKLDLQLRVSAMMAAGEARVNRQRLQLDDVLGNVIAANPQSAHPPSAVNLTGRNRKRCGARTKTRNGAPCQCKVVPGRTRCKLHGGLSTGPRTSEGKARCAEGVRQHFSRKVERSAPGE